MLIECLCYMFLVHLLFRICWRYVLIVFFVDWMKWMYSLCNNVDLLRIILCSINASTPSYWPKYKFGLHVLVYYIQLGQESKSLCLDYSLFCYSDILVCDWALGSSAPLNFSHIVIGYMFEMDIRLRWIYVFVIFYFF